MPWVRIDDGLWSHPKMNGISNDALALFICGLSYSGQYLTDGMLSDADVERLAAFRRTRPEVIDELVDARLWERCDRGFRVHDFDKYNKSRAEILRERAAAADRQEKHRGATSPNSNGVSHGEVTRDRVSDFAVTSGAPYPVPVPGPVPIPKPKPEKGRADEPTDRPSNVDNFESDAEWFAALRRTRQTWPLNDVEAKEWRADMEWLREHHVRISDAPAIIHRCNLTRNYQVTPRVIRERVELEVRLVVENAAYDQELKAMEEAEKHGDSA